LFKLEEIDASRIPDDFMVCDPGYNTLLKSDSLAYRRKQFSHDAGYNERQRKLARWNKALQPALRILANNTLHTASVFIFKRNLQEVVPQWSILIPEYQSRRRARLNFDVRIKKQRTMDRLALKLVGDNKVLFVGDASWSPQTGGCQTGPVTMLRNHLATKGRVVLVPEFLTTRVCSHCHRRMVHEKNHVHGLYHCQSCCKTWNRDFNAHRNQLDCVLHHFNGLPRPDYLARGGPNDKNAAFKLRLNDARGHNSEKS
jgi:hypothetical protein